ncbi:MAG TPA: cytochrome d ubiquinol oxidase subunit II [Candidatus Eisenbacteria bacterium]|nr:cytochrome d ubiquinol oxidase subunit II [Candidatus Eisenbacteria bacterium]
METLWFCLVAVMLAAYVVFDGFDLGAGIVHLFVARTGEERRAVLGTIGPVWDGNEVWLIAAGGTLYFAFPALYAASFSGFYLPLMIVLWLLILRGCSIEFRNHIDSDAWRPLWDATFAFSSTLLAIFFGAALGNVVRGVPFDENGRFFEPLWVNFRPGPDAGILDWYTVLVGLAACVALAMHGALWVTLKTQGLVATRARAIARRTWIGAAGLTALVTWSTMRLQPQVLANLSRHPWGFLFPGLALAGLAGAWWYSRRSQEREAFLASCAYLTGMISSAAFGIYPYVLPSITDPARALTVRNAAAQEYGLRIGLIWWIIGMALVAVYFTYVYRKFAGKVRLGREGEGY